MTSASRWSTPMMRWPAGSSRARMARPMPPADPVTAMTLSGEHSLDRDLHGHARLEPVRAALDRRRTAVRLKPVHLRPKVVVDGDAGSERVPSVAVGDHVGDVADVAPVVPGGRPVDLHALRAPEREEQVRVGERVLGAVPTDR